MREIAGAGNGDAFELRPFAEMLEIKLRAGGAREMRVEVEVGDKFHFVQMVGGVYFYYNSISSNTITPNSVTRLSAMSLVRKASQPEAIATAI